MRHSGQDFRSNLSAAIGRCTVLAAFLAVSIYAVTSQAQAPDPTGAEITLGEVTGVRLGRHKGFLRLVFDVTARPEYGARATGARTFEVVLPGVTLPPEGYAALAADPLAPDLIVRPAETDGGPLRFGVASRFAAFIRRAFVLDPPAGGMPAGSGVWRLVLDVVPRPDVRPDAYRDKSARAILPPLHGLDLPGKGEAPTGEEHLTDKRAPALAGVPSLTGAGPGRPAQVEVSWARASRILRELQDRRASQAETDIPPQLVLAPKYRRAAVPLR